MRLAQEAGFELRLKVIHPGEPVALSDVLPMLENLGMRVINEIPFEVKPRDAEKPIWIQDFELLPRGVAALDVDAVKQRFEEAFRDVWSGVVESDGFNRLVLTAGMSAREVMVLRTYCKLLRQAGSQLQPGLYGRHGERLSGVDAIAGHAVRTARRSRNR